MVRSTVKWDKRFLDLAEHISGWSKDPSTKVGAVIVDSKGRIVSLGYNGFPRGVEDTQFRYETKELKHAFVCHAEQNALDQSPHSVEGCILYSTLLPCNLCAKSIIQRGIAEVVTYSTDREDTFRWDVTLDMFRESGVALRYFYSDSLEKDK